MASNSQSFQTETTLDVSQHAHSSPMNYSKKVPAQETVDVVEDSLKDVPEAYRGGAVQAPKMLPSDNEDEASLYAVSPEAKNAPKERPAAAKKSIEPAKDVPSHTAVAKIMETLGEECNTQQVRPTQTPNLIDGLLRVGATAVRNDRPAGTHTTVQMSDVDDNGQCGGVRNQVDTDLCPDQIDEPQAEVDVPSVSGGSRGNRSKKAQLPQRAAVMPASQISSTLSTKPATSRSSLAALRARNGVLDAGTHTLPEPSVPFVKASHTIAKAHLETNDKEYSRPFNSTKVTAKAHIRPSTGKLPARKGGIFASTQSVASTDKRGPSIDYGNDESDRAVEGPAPTKRGAQKSASKRESEKPSKKTLPRAAKKDIAYDFAESPESVASEKPARRARTSKAPPARGQRGATAKPAPRGRARQSAEEPRHDRDVARPRNSRSVQSWTRPIPQKNNDDVLEHRKSSVPPPREALIVPDNHAVARANALDAPRAQIEVGETLDDFEASVVQYDPEDRYTDGDTKAVSNIDQHDERDMPIQKMNIKESTGSMHTGHHRYAEAATMVSVPEESNPQPLTLLAHTRQSSLALEDDADEGGRPNRRMQRTPRVVSSSPPAVTVSKGVMGRSISNKPSVIAFSKNGPRNQGNSSAKKAVPGSTRSTRSSFPPHSRRLGAAGLASAATLKDKMGNRPSETVANVESQRTEGMAAKTNVADNVVDALNEFTRRASSTMPQLAPRSRPPAAPVAPNKTNSRAFLHLEPDNAEFINIDDFDGPTIVAEERTAVKTAVPKNLLERTVSQVAMPPPPASKLSQMGRIGRASVTSPKGAAQSHPVPDVDSAEISEISKRARDEEPLGQPAPKRQRASITHSAEAVESSKDTIPERNAPLECHEPDSSHQEQRQKRERVKPNSQKSYRPASYGSQKVDIHGSPIPHGMTVQHKATVLETFSQQADLSSDNVILYEVVPVAAVTTTRSNVTVTAQQAILPSCQPDPMSSNKRRKPSGPKEESQGITRVEIKDPHRLLVEDQARRPSPDPFTSSDSSRKQPQQEIISSSLADQPGQKHEDKQIADLQQLPIVYSVQRKAAAAVHEEQIRPQVETDLVSDNRGSTKYQDLDKTLVEIEPEYHSRKRKRAPSLSTVSSDATRSRGQSPTMFDDVGAWRNALQPHQGNLFDELVIVSHRLVRHLVDTETAMRDIVEDYRRQGLGLVEQMEFNHAREYQKFANNLQLRKKELRQEYIDCSDQLKVRVAAVEAARQERKKAWKNRDATVERMQGLLAVM